MAIKKQLDNWNFQNLEEISTSPGQNISPAW